MNERRIELAVQCKCPFCEKEDLDYGVLEPIENGTVEQKVRCRVCRKVWKDCFSLFAVHELPSSCFNNHEFGDPRETH